MLSLPFLDKTNLTNQSMISMTRRLVITVRSGGGSYLGCPEKTKRVKGLGFVSCHTALLALNH
jgi:hypothetical protein